MPPRPRLNLTILTPILTMMLLQARFKTHATVPILVPILRSLRTLRPLLGEVLGFASGRCCGAGRLCSLRLRRSAPVCAPGSVSRLPETRSLLAERDASGASDRRPA